MAGMWDVAGKVKVFHKKAVLIGNWPGVFQEKYFIKCELSKYVYLPHCESTCRERMIQEISIPKQQFNSLPPPCCTFGPLIRSMH